MAINVFIFQLPLLSTINALFPKKKITEHSIVLVRDLEVLQSISSIVSTTDARWVIQLMVDGDKEEEEQRN